MDQHFGKFKFRSGNIPFTIFGPFDQKTDVLFKDTTDSFKTSYEIANNTKFERNIESFYTTLLNDNSQYCSNSAHYLININFMYMLAVSLIALNIL